MIELVPRSLWNKNIRSYVSDRQWTEIKRKVYCRDNYRCVICGGTGDKWPVEAHEIWQYDDINHIQKLVNIVSLCPNCHKCKHIGRTLSVSDSTERKKIMDHFKAVNKISEIEASKHINIAFDKWHERNQHDWHVDIAALTKLTT